MIIRFHSRFRKRYTKLPSRFKKKIEKVITIFQKDPFHISLRNHELKGVLSGKRSITVTGNMRILFEEYDSYVIVIFLDVGVHDDVYDR